MSSILICKDGEFHNFKEIDNQLLMSILENFKDDDEKTIINVTVVKEGE